MLKSYRSTALVPVLRQPLKAGLMLLMLNGFWFSAAAASAPAPWFLWQSRVDGAYLCIQTTPGEGWVKIAGPYPKAQCHRIIKELLIKLKS